VLEISAIEYSDAIYTKNNLYREVENKNTGIATRRTNNCLYLKDLDKVNKDLSQKQVKPNLSQTVFLETAGQVNITETIYTTSDLDFFFNSGGTGDIYDLGLQYTVDFDGEYNVEYNISWGLNHQFDGAGKFYIPEGARKFQGIVLDVNGSTGTSSYASRDGSYYGDSLENFRLQGKFNWSKDDVIDFKSYLMSEFGPNHPDNFSGFAGAIAFVVVTITVSYLG